MTTAPSAPLDADGAFAIHCAPANVELGLIVLSPDAERAVAAFTQLEEGADQTLRLVVERRASIPGSLIAPEDASPTDYGLWACAHDADHLAGATKSPKIDLWVPIRPDGTFDAGPLDAERDVRLRACLRTPNARGDAELIGPTLTVRATSALAGAVRVDLRGEPSITWEPADDDND